MRLRLPAAALAAMAVLGLGGCTDNTVFSLNLGEVAVVPGDFDTPEAVLDKLEVGYTRYDGWHDNGPRYDYEGDYDWTALSEDPNAEVEDFLTDKYAIGAFDVVFLSSGMRGAGEFLYNNANEPDDQLVTDPAVVASVQECVDQGGHLYVTDWAYDLIEVAFPDAVDFLGDDLNLDDAQRGEPQTVNARVIDEALMDSLEMSAGANEVEAIFNFDSWAVVEAVGADTTVLVEADVIYQDGADMIPIAASPVVLEFEHGAKGGKVIYSAFHTEAQITTDVQDIINFLIFGFNKVEEEE